MPIQKLFPLAVVVLCACAGLTYFAIGDWRNGIVWCGVAVADMGFVL